MFNKFFKRNNIQWPEDAPENWHVEFIVHLAAIIRPRLYVELGLYECELFNKIIPYAEKLIGIDTNKESGKFMKKISEKTEFFNMTTNDFAKYVVKNSLRINMLFIDADHSEKSVQKDFLNFFSHVVDQGIILLHDSYPKNREYSNHGYCGDGYKAIEKLSKSTTEYEMMTIPVHPGLTLCRKRKQQLKWSQHETL